MLYPILVSAITMLVIYACVKWRYGFWMHQPVYHVYDWHYSVGVNRVISPGLPSINKYVNTISILTKLVPNMSELEWTSFAVFVQKYFLREPHNIYNPKLENIVPYFKNNKSLVSTYYDTINYKNQTDGSIVVNDRNIIGVMTSRPVYGIINNVSVPIYYVDYLCVHPKKRKSGVASEIIQTHHYNQRRINPSIQVSLFKRENDLTWIVPITYYDTVVYDTIDCILDVRLHQRYSILQATPGNIQRIMRFISENCSKYDVCIYDDLETTLARLSTNNLYMYALVNKDVPEDDISALYVFKNPCVSVSAKQVVTCIGSICGNVSNEVFHYAFINLLPQFNKSYGNSMLAIETISDNYRLIESITHAKIKFTTPTAYFLYNYVAQPIISNKCLILI